MLPCATSARSSASSPSVGDVDDVAPAVGRVPPALHELEVLQVVEHQDARVGVHRQVLGHAPAATTLGWSRR